MKFDTAYGTAILVIDEKETPVRVALNSFNNTILCSFKSEINGFRYDLSLIGKQVNLKDIEFVGDGVKWTSPEINELTVWSFRPARGGLGESEIGEITGQNEYRNSIVLSKNGSHSFDLDKEFERSFEFAGGADIFPPIEISDGVFFYSDGKRSKLYGVGCKDLDLKDEISALSLACGTVLAPRFEVNRRKLTMVFRQSLDQVKSIPIFEDATNGFTDSSKKNKHFAKVYQCAKNKLDEIPKGSKAEIKHLIFLFLNCRAMVNVLDIQALSIFMFFEAIDGSKTLSGNRLAPLLGIELDTANELVKVRNKVSHGTHTLDEAIKKFVDIEHSDYNNFRVKGKVKSSSVVTVANFLHGKANQCMLKLIECDVPASKPYSTS